LQQKNAAKPQFFASIRPPDNEMPAIAPKADCDFAGSRQFLIIEPLYFDENI
jgi:hypothetical protein